MQIAQLLRTQRGMSLTELMVVMLIVAILGIVGVPSYRGYMQRAQRTEAKDALLRLANNQEKFYMQNNTYTANVADLGFEASGSTTDGSYTVSVTAANNQGFTARASVSSSGGMYGDECSWFQIDEAGVKDAAHVSCW